MSLDARYDGVRSERLRHAFAMQEIESSPPTDAELQLYARMENKGWSDQRMAKVMRRIVISRLQRSQRIAAE
ncbi:hypothetical protein [Pseudaestuariivita rosea]|uniref:hypothetical protein n=1 Tax=Pseudaestuariivita rosea TaxID=2763263 RepID=UPI001ABA42B7|nr:hypothetical protein [Pseudaestuariivita rosea]